MRSRPRPVPSVDRPHRSRGAFSLLETLLATIILLVCFYAIFTLLRTGRKMEDRLGNTLGLQADAHRALIVLMREMQESIILVQPTPGHTLPHAVLRDKLDRIALYSLEPVPGKNEYRLRRDLAAAPPAKVKTDYLLTGIRRLTFTALSDGAVMLHLVLGSGQYEYAFHTEVRFRNRDAAEVP